jgi:hypothetical protein
VGGGGLGEDVDGGEAEDLLGGVEDGGAGLGVAVEDDVALRREPAEHGEKLVGGDEELAGFVGAAASGAGVVGQIDDDDFSGAEEGAVLGLGDPLDLAALERVRDVVVGVEVFGAEYGGFAVGHSILRDGVEGVRESHDGSREEEPERMHTDTPA